MAEPDFFDRLERTLHGLLLPRRLWRAFLAGCVVAAGSSSILWFAYVDAPSPAEICRHKMELILSESSREQSGAKTAEDLVARLEAQCIAGAENKIRLDGKIAYAGYARCLAAATTLNQAERC